MQLLVGPSKEDAEMEEAAWPSEKAAWQSEKAAWQSEEVGGGCGAFGGGTGRREPTITMAAALECTNMLALEGADTLL